MFGHGRNAHPSTTRPVVLVAVSLVLFVVLLMSAAIPANRAASIQPADALRTD
jgi:ABC-type lipoprotein release transport system permease subunit